MSVNKNSENNEKYNNVNSSSSRNNIYSIENYIFSKNENKIKPKNIINNRGRYKNIKIQKNIKFIYRNFSKENNISSKIKQTEFDTHNYANKLELPIIVINDKEVKINENNIDNRYIYKNNYRYLLKSIDSKNKKLVELINSKEIKNFVIYLDPNDSIEKKNKYKNLFSRKKELLFFYRNNNSKISI